MFFFQGVCMSMQGCACRVLKLSEWFCEHFGTKNKKRDRASTLERERKKKGSKGYKSNANIYSKSCAEKDRHG